MDPVPALVAIVYFALAGLAFERIVRAPATRAGEVFQNASLNMHVTVLQTLQGIKEVKVRRTSAYFLDRYDASGAATPAPAGSRPSSTTCPATPSSSSSWAVWPC